MKSYLTTIATATIIGGSVLGGGTALAAKGGVGGFGRSAEAKQAVLQEQASWLGISEDQLWGELKTKDFKQVAIDHGKTEEQVKQHREEAKSNRKENRQEKREEHKQNITNKLKEKGFSDDQIKSIFEVFEAERPKPDQQD